MITLKRLIPYEIKFQKIDLLYLQENVQKFSQKTCTRTYTQIFTIRSETLLKNTLIFPQKPIHNTTSSVGLQQCNLRV